MKVKIKLIPTAGGRTVSPPEYQSGFSAGADLCACVDEPVVLPPHGRALIPSGIAIEPEDTAFAAFVFARSGLSSKHGVCLANGVGVVDSDYRGEIKVALVNTSDEPYTVRPFERVAQLVFMRTEAAEFLLSDTLSETERGAGGFGSTGK